MNLLKRKISPLVSRFRKSFLSLFSAIFKRNKDITENYSELDKKMVYSLSNSKIPNLTQIKHIKRFLTKKEKLIIRIASFVILINLVFLSFNFIKNNLVIVPSEGGIYVEGVVGSPKHINPLYASISDIDSDLSNLVFSSLFKYDENGNLIEDLVDSYKIVDGLEYIIWIKNDVKWHKTGKNLTIDDILFTFNAIKNQEYESPLRNNFVGVKIEKINEESFKFVLTEKYTPFLNLLTFGILSQDQWSQINAEGASLAEANLKPIGSGPYQFKKLFKDKSGNIRSYLLEVNKDYYGKKPYLEEIHFKFFVNFIEAVNALNEDTIDGVSYLPPENRDDVLARDSINFHNLTLPQIKTVFFNQDKNEAFKNLQTRKALTYAISKEGIVKDVLNEEVKIAHGPIADNNFSYNSELEKYEYNQERSKELLKEAGWIDFVVTEEDIQLISDKEIGTSTEEKITEEDRYRQLLGVGNWLVKKDNEEKIFSYFIVNFTTVDDEESIKVAEAIKKYWEQIGVKTNINIIPSSQIQTDVISTRQFEVLLFGQLLSRDPDLYAFWHSSQVGENGLNIANYANADVDKILEEGRAMSEETEEESEKRIKKYKEFQRLLNSDIPAIFLYSPTYTYIQAKNIKGFNVNNIYSPSHRFNNINDWYIKTKKKLNLSKK